MGIEYSSESQEGLPVTGLPNSLEILKVQLHIAMTKYLCICSIQDATTSLSFMIHNPKSSMTFK